MDKSLIIALLAKYGNCCSMVWACRQSQWKKCTLSFSEEVGKQLHNILKRNFGCDFLSLRTTIVLQLKKYPSTSMSCCSDDLAQFLLWLDFEVWGPRIYRSENKFLPLACGPMWLRICPCNSIVCSIIPRLNSTGMQFIDSYIPRPVTVYYRVVKLELKSCMLQHPSSQFSYLDTCNRTLVYLNL